MSRQHLVERLIDLEDRVYRLYCTFGDCMTFQAGVRFLWKCMAEDERRHLTTLQRSEQLVDLAQAPPAIPEKTFVEVTAKLEAAELAVQRAELTLDEAFRHALSLESSELNRLDESWFHSFPPAVGEILSLLTPPEDEHIRRLVEAVQAFSQDTRLHDQATQMWIAHQRRKDRAPNKTPLT